MISADAIRGHIDLIVLAILEHEPSYAYEICRLITEQSDGAYTIKQTTLYTALKRLEKQNYLKAWEQESVSGKTRTYYSITTEGTSFLAHKREEWSRITELIEHFVHGGTA